MYMILFQQRLWKYIAPGTLVPVDRGMIQIDPTDLDKPTVSTGFQVGVSESSLYDLKLIDKFCRAIGYDNGKDFYFTWRKLQRKELIHELKLTHYHYQDMLNAVTIEVRGKWCDLGFKDIALIHKLYRCDIVRKDDMTRITFGI
jgi:hypothetical protein